jgi:O-antigen/teichoic acid export membrane protein
MLLKSAVDGKLLNKELLKLASMTIMVGITVRIYGLVDQLSASRLGPKFLETHVIIAYAPFFINCLGLVVGRALIVFLNRELDADAKKQLVANAIKFVIFAGTAATILMTCFRTALAKSFGLSVDSTSIAYFFILSVSAVIYNAATVIRFSFIANRRLLDILKADILGNSINIAGNYIAIRELESVESKFLGCAVATLFAQSSVTIFYLLNRFPISTASASDFWVRCKNFMVGDGIRVYLTFALPFAYTWLFQSYLTSDTVSGYNVGFQWAYLVSMVNTGFFLAGTAWLSSRDADQNMDLRIGALARNSIIFAIIPISLLLLMSRPMFAIAYGLSSSEALWIFRLTLFNLIPACTALARECWLQSRGRTHLLAKIDLLFVGLFGLSMTWLGLKNFNPVLAYGIGTTIPALTRAGFIFYTTRHKPVTKE